MNLFLLCINLFVAIAKSNKTDSTGTGHNVTRNAYVYSILEYYPYGTVTGARHKVESWVKRAKED